MPPDPPGHSLPESNPKRGKDTEMKYLTTKKEMSSYVARTERTVRTWQRAIKAAGPVS